MRELECFNYKGFTNIQWVPFARAHTFKSSLRSFRDSQHWFWRRLNSDHQKERILRCLATVEQSFSLRVEDNGERQQRKKAETWMKLSIYPQEICQSPYYISSPK